MRTNLTVADLGDLLDQPLVAVLATLRTDGTVLLSPVYHEWRDGGFNVWVEQQNIKARHLRRDHRATTTPTSSALTELIIEGSSRATARKGRQPWQRIRNSRSGPGPAAPMVTAARCAA